MFKEHSDERKSAVRTSHIHTHIYIVYVCVCIYHPKDRMSHHCGALAEMRNSSMDPPGGIDLMLHHTLGGTLPLRYVLLTCCSVVLNL